MENRQIKTTSSREAQQGNRYLKLNRNDSNQRIDNYDDDIIPDLTGATDWDIALRYTDFGVPLTRGTPLEQTALNLRYVAAMAIMQRARQVLGSISQPTHKHSGSWDQLPVDATQVELQIENTIENAPLAMANIINEINTDVPLYSHDIWMKYELHKKNH